jgi:uncharacterized SAM-binding protein YcdF (DUF218 family)
MSLALEIIITYLVSCAFIGVPLMRKLVDSGKFAIRDPETKQPITDKRRIFKLRLQIIFFWPYVFFNAEY